MILLAHDDHDMNGKGTASHNGSGNSTPVMKRQGSKLSYGSNDSGESTSSQGINNKVKIWIFYCHFNKYL